MNKLIGGLALSLAMCVVDSTFAQEDPFATPSFQPTPEESRSIYLEVPQAQPLESQPQPIIESLPAETQESVTTENAEPSVPRMSQRPVISGSLTSRPKNAHVRQTRTAAQEYIYRRAVYHAKQRTDRIEQRKWRGESALRPSNPSMPPYYNETSLPTWGINYTRIR